MLILLIQKILRNASDKKTRAYFGETLPNPKLDIFPIEEISTIGKEIGIPLILDNTAAPYICKPFSHGASIVIHSTTKFIGGQGSAIGGVIIDGGNFQWESFKEQQPALNSLLILVIMELFGLKLLNHWDLLLTYLKLELLSKRFRLCNESF